MFPSKFDFFRSGLQGQFIGRLLLAASMMPWNCQEVVGSDHDEPLFSRSKMKGAKSESHDPINVPVFSSIAIKNHWIADHFQVAKCDADHLPDLITFASFQVCFLKACCLESP
jgi:hypothetical protein